MSNLRELLPGFGSKLAVDSTDILAYSNGHRKNPSDKDARWGAKKAEMHKNDIKGQAAEGEKR